MPPGSMTVDARSICTPSPTSTPSTSGYSQESLLRDVSPPTSDDDEEVAKSTSEIPELSWVATQHARNVESDRDEQTEAQKLHTLTAAIKIMISCLGEDPTREGLLDTPQRYAKALLSFTEGYHMKVANVINNAIFHVDEGSDMVIVKDIEVFSLCEHHLVPFMGKIHVGYLPDGRVIGLSKIARIVEVFARRLQVQERLTRQVALAIEEVLKPHGVAVVMESSHLCMIMRGVQKTNSSTTTRCMLGSFNHEADLRKEFLSLLRAR